MTNGQIGCEGKEELGEGRRARREGLSWWTVDADAAFLGHGPDQTPQRWKLSGAGRRGAVSRAYRLNVERGIEKYRV